MWSYGFVFYGLNIIIRIFTQEYELDALGVLSSILIFCGYSFMFIGLGDIIDKTREMTIMVMLSPLFTLGGYLLGFGWAGSLATLILIMFLLIGVTLVYIHYKSENNLSILILGWVMILMLNISFVTGVIEPGLVDLLQSIQKVILYIGITQPRFTFIAEQFENYMISGLSSEFVDLSSGSISFVDLSDQTRQKEEDWILSRARVNKAKGVRTIVISMYDLLSTPSMSEAWSNNDLYYVKVIQGVRESSGVFEEQTMTLRDDLRIMNLFFKDIIDYSVDKKIPCEIILHNLSTLIHSHKWKPVYSLFISLNPIIKNSSVNLIFFYYPETHEEGSDIKKFETLADTFIHV